MFVGGPRDGAVEAQEGDVRDIYVAMTTPLSARPFDQDEPWAFNLRYGTYRVWQPTLGGAKLLWREPA